jgi:hypothetical protein
MLFTSSANVQGNNSRESGKGKKKKNPNYVYKK